MRRIVSSWVVFVPHMNITHETGNESQRGQGKRDWLADGRTETNTVTDGFPSQMPVSLDVFFDLRLN